MDNQPQSVEDLIRQFGEEHRIWIVRALKFLDEHEANWNLPSPINRQRYLASIAKGLAR